MSKAPENSAGRSGGKRLLVLTLLLVINSAYVAAFGDANLFYVANAFLHPFSESWPEFSSSSISAATASF